MINEAFFFLQVAVVASSVLGARRLGKEAVMVLAVLLALLANFFVLKQISLFGWSVTCSDAYAIGHLLCLNLLQQTFGKEAAKQTVVISFATLLLFTVLAEIHLLYHPSLFDQSHPHYAALLGIAPRLLAASLLTFYCVQQLDLFLFGQLAKQISSWQLRSSVSMVITQGVDTLLFTLLGLYGVVEEWTSIFWMSYGIKCSAIGAMSLLLNRRLNYEV